MCLLSWVVVCHFEQPLSDTIMTYPVLTAQNRLQKPCDDYLRHRWVQHAADINPVFQEYQSFYQSLTVEGEGTCGVEREGVEAWHLKAKLHFVFHRYTFTLNVLKPCVPTLEALHNVNF